MGAVETLLRRNRSKEHPADDSDIRELVDAIDGRLLLDGMGPLGYSISIPLFCKEKGVKELIIKRRIISSDFHDREVAQVRLRKERIDIGPTAEEYEVIHISQNPEGYSATRTGVIYPSSKGDLKGIEWSPSMVTKADCKLLWSHLRNSSVQKQIFPNASVA